MTMDPTCDDLGATAEAQKVEAFLDAGARFEADSLALAAEVEGTCDAIAADLGVTVPSAAEGELQVEASCAAVSQEIRAILDASLPAGASLELIYEPPVCSFALDAMAECVAECDVNVDANVEVECTEGRLVGSCSGTCTGECRVEGAVECDSSCSGTCTGSCTGTCFGACDGECSAFDGEGNCVGTCTGTCEGSCSGTCSGSCEGSCTAGVAGTCEGTCAGSCDVELEAPRCEGMASVEADATCEAACEAEVSARAECTEPEVALYVSAEVDPAAQARLAELVTTLQANYPRLLVAQEKLMLVASSGAEMVTAFEGAADAAGELGFRASACFASTTLDAASALSTVEVSLSVTVEVSASVSAEANAG